MRLPNAEQAVVAREKITDYLLSFTSTRGRAKAYFFVRFGFEANRWEEIADALLLHCRQNPVAHIKATDFGIQYAIIGLMKTPDGREPNVRTVWQIDYGYNYPRFISAYRARS